MDRAEPFRPQRIGLSAFAAETPSPSSKFTVTPRGEACYEFAIFWDYDIGHLYDLEHIWVHESKGEVVAVEASFHGQRHDVEMCLRAGRPLVWVEAGKHAHLQSRAQRDAMAEATRLMCGSQAGIGGIHTANPFSAGFGDLSDHDHRLARLFLSRLQFTTTGGRALEHDLNDTPMVPWPEMPDFIAARLRHVIAKLHRDVAHMPAIFFDCGDTLVDEGTEVKRTDGSDVVLRADLLPDAEAVLRQLSGLGYRLCLVADGPRETFENVLKPAGLWELFEAHVISGDVGVRKPDPKMFETARERMGLSPDQARFVPMIGNNLDRDILGANRAGHPSVFFNWSPRRRRVPEGPPDTPTFQVSSLSALIPALTAFEFSLTMDV
ncbi:HAD family hydrolase [Candidatus Rhodobacter oscarellae]|nr:HAD-IA family hydrolase [Candidatus Rhodobacter lobularis]